MSGSGISWAICKSEPRSRQITMPAPHHSVFTGRMPFLPPNQQRQSTETCYHTQTLTLSSTMEVQFRKTVDSSSGLINCFIKLSTNNDNISGTTTEYNTKPNMQWLYHRKELLHWMMSCLKLHGQHLKNNPQMWTHMNYLSSCLKSSRQLTNCHTEKLYCLQEAASHQEKHGQSDMEHQCHFWSWCCKLNQHYSSSTSIQPACQKVTLCSLLLLHVAKHKHNQNNSYTTG